MQEALRKILLMPARAMEGFVSRMKKRGRLREGMDADVVVLDPDTISGVGTCEQPNHPAVGVPADLVNDVPVVLDRGLVPDAGPGKPTRRPVSPGVSAHWLARLLSNGGPAG